MALSKRSRTKVYSGKSVGMKCMYITRHTFERYCAFIIVYFYYQDVPSLFDMCMNVLVNNIEGNERGKDGIINIIY